MENIAHTLCGLRIADLGFREKVGPRAPWIAAIAVNIPDIDSVLALFDFEIYLEHHRGLTHSFFGFPFLILFGAFLSYTICKKGRFKDHLSLWALSIFSHMLFDWITVWGTLLLWPLSRTRFALDLIFIVDPAFWILLGFLPWFLKRRDFSRKLSASIALFSIVGWFLFAGILREEAAAKMPAKPVQVFPGPLAPFSWTGVSYQEDFVERFWLTPWSITPAGQFSAPIGDVAKEIRKKPEGKRRFWMSRAPVFLSNTRRADGFWEIHMIDLAYTSPLAPENTPFEKTFLIQTPNE